MKSSLKRILSAMLAVAVVLPTSALAMDFSKPENQTAEKLEEFTRTRQNPWLSNFHYVSQLEIEKDIHGGECMQCEYAVAISPDDENYRLYGTDTSGIHYTHNGGKQWHIVEKNLEGSVGCVSFYPGDKNIAFASTSDNGRLVGIYRSADGGRTWDFIKYLGQRSKFQNVDSFVYGPPNEEGIRPIYTIARNTTNTPTSTGDSGVFVSYDIGLTWEQIPYFDGFSTSEKAEPRDLESYYDDQGTILLLAAKKSGNRTDSDYNGIYASFDEGKTWQKKSNGLDGYGMDFIEIDPTNRNHWIAAVAVGQKDAPTDRANNYYNDIDHILYETLDCGETWNPITTDWNHPRSADMWDTYWAEKADEYVPFDGNIWNLQYGYPITREDGTVDVPLAITMANGHHSTRLSWDHGRTNKWLNFIRIQGVGSYLNTQWYGSPVAFSKQNPNNIQAGSYYSDDGGLTFKEDGHAGISGYMGVTWIFDENGNLTHTGGFDVGVWKRVPGYEWYDGDYPPVSVAAHYDVGGGSTVYSILVDSQNPLHMFSTYGGGPSYGSSQSIRETWDGFDSFTSYKDLMDYNESQRKEKKSVITVNKFFQHPQKPNIIYAQGLMSTNSGKTWFQPEHPIWLMNPNDGDIVYSCEKGELLVSYNCGRNWQSTGFKMSSPRIDTVEADPHYNNVIWFGNHGGGKVYRIDLEAGEMQTFGPDNGIKTKGTEADQLSLNVTKLAVDPVTKDHVVIDCQDFYAGGNVAVETWDGGKTWTSLDKYGSRHGWGHMQFHPTRNLLYFGAGDGVWVIDYKIYNKIQADGFLDNKSGNANYEEIKNAAAKGVLTWKTLDEPKGDLLPDNTWSLQQANASFVAAFGSGTYVEFTEETAATPITYGQVCEVIAKQLDADATDYISVCKAKGIADFAGNEAYTADTQIKRKDAAYMMSKVADLLGK